MVKATVIAKKEQPKEKNGTKDSRMPIIMVEEKLPDEPSLQIPIIFRSTPKCSSEEQYFKWREKAKKIPPQTYNFCTDCTREYQAEMLEARRCTHPEIKFRKQGKLMNEGFIPDPEGII
jgi:hypothetical protein